MLSSISSIIREFVYSESDTTPSNPTESQPDITPSPENVPPLQLTFRKERTETFVTNDASYDDHFLEYHTSGYDVIAHLPPSTIQSTINFSSHRAGIAALGKNQSLVSNPYEEDPDLRNDSWQCIPVPHLPKSKAFRRRLPMYSILGPIVYSGLMTTRYIAMGNNTSVSSASSTGPLYPAPVDYGSDNTPLDATISPQGAGTPLGNEIDRIVVLSSREDKEGGEIRLYDIVSLQLFAVIRLNSVTKVRYYSCC